MKNWFDEMRVEMLNKACEKVLSPQVQGALSFADIIQIAGLLESHNTEATIRNAIKFEEGGISGDIDLISEMSQAIMAEAVQMFDSKTISNFTWGAEKEHILDLSEDGDSIPSTPVYIGDKLSIIPEKIKKIVCYFPDDGESFILCTPVMLSILQACTKSTFVADTKEAFKGPNNIMLVGSLDNIPIYSYLADYKFGSDPNDEDLILIGNYQKGKDGAVTQRLLVKNISFV